MSTKISHRPHRQMSESFLTAGFLSLSGGLQDAYTYMSRGKVFANAQTGNIVLLSQSIGSGDWPLAIHYLAATLRWLSENYTGQIFIFSCHTREEELLKELNIPHQSIQL